ncbi:uncharacterized protein ASPGLDRAFT_709721 [Aspergillus glaucus CBS 516.65]|uniref:Uncharacterized protein n=1 Tax=Aspergillus glaucus CBS 516.65 TaxID=1160497 RepID=A0A1L9VX22_ASPGL|nr:hypothetical protein ASPGLDRAFT_709721 [Aspergillus glaucus CBS 516.65]OJJ88468.1 hypothetical protein ASPGLDRAFT_709721 [Aspergillus glaucus CBS 516.65]
MFSVLTRIRLGIVAGSYVLPRVVRPITPGALWLGIKWWGVGTTWVMIVLFCFVAVVVWRLVVFSFFVFLFVGIVDCKLCGNRS